MHCYFARELLSWCLPVPGDLALLITVGEDVHVLGAHEAASASLKVSRNWADGIGEGREGRKRFRLQRKTQTLPSSSRKRSRAAESNTWEKVAFS